MPLPPLSEPMPRWQLYAIPLGLVAVAGSWSSQVLFLAVVVFMAWTERT